MSYFGSSGAFSSRPHTIGVRRNQEIPVVGKCYQLGSKDPMDPQDYIGQYVGDVGERHIFRKTFKVGIITDTKISSEGLRDVYLRECPLAGGRRRNKHKKTKKAHRNKSHTRKN